MDQPGIYAMRWRMLTRQGPKRPVMKYATLTSGASSSVCCAVRRNRSTSAVTPGIKSAQLAISRAHHIVLFFPLWLGHMPAQLKGFLEQVMRPGFSFQKGGGIPFANKALTGRSARVVVTMGMPAMMCRWYFRAHSVKSLEPDILGFTGISPMHETLIGRVGQLTDAAAKKWLVKPQQMGREAG